MRSVRLNEQLEKRLAQAVRISGQPASRIIREAVEKRCDELLGESFASRFADIIGSVDSGGGRTSRRTGEEFASILDEKAARRRGRRK